MSLRCRLRVGGILSVVGSFCALSISGCRDNEPETTPPPSPGGTGGQDTRPREAEDREQPAPPRAVGVDDKDDPRSPTCLPRSNEIGRWIKSEPVRVVDAAAIGDVVSGAETARFAYFATITAARCGYTVARGDTTLRVQVVVVETESADDAYGLMSCQSNSRRTVPIGGETRVERRDGLHLHCWQGRSYIHLWTDRPTADGEAALGPLLRHIAARIPREESPELLDAMPRDEKDPGQRWLVRHLGGLASGALGPTAPPDLAKVAELLGLGRDTRMCIASYMLPAARGPNIVWLVRYPTTEAATLAHDRCAAHLAGATDPAWESTMLMPPHGRFLIGTWTAEEESLQYMMPRIEKLLPS